MEIKSLLANQNNYDGKRSTSAIKYTIKILIAKISPIMGGNAITNGYVKIHK